MTTDTQPLDNASLLPTLDTTVASSDLVHDMAAANGSGPGSNLFRPMSDAGFTFIATMLTVTYVLGSFINGLCLFVFARNKRLRSPTNVFVIALNLCDFLMCFCAIPLTMTSAWAHRWLWGDAMSTLEGFLVYFLGLSSMYILMAIAVDRYIAISKPLLGAKITKKMAVLSCVLCYLGGFVWSAMPLVGWNEYALEGAGISSSVVWESSQLSHTSYIYTIFFACLVVPLCVMLYSYYGVLRTLRSLNQNSVWDMNSRVAKKNLAIEKKMFRTALLLIGAYLLCWLPYAIVSFVAAFGGHDIVPTFLATVPPIIAKSQGLIDPVIYIASNAQMRAVVIDMLPCAGLKACLLAEDNEKEEEVDSEESDMDDNADPARRQSKEKCLKTGSSSSSSKKGKGKSAKKSANNNSEVGGKNAKKKKSFIGGKKNAVHALSVEPTSADEGASEISNLDPSVAVALTPVQTISIPPRGDGGGGAGDGVVGAQKESREDFNSHPEIEAGAAP